MRYLVVATMCAVVVAAAGLGLLARGALTDAVPKARIQADVHLLEHAQAGVDGFDAGRTEVRDLLALDAFGTAPGSLATLVPDTGAPSRAVRAQLVAELTAARRTLDRASTQLSVPVSVQRAIVTASSDTRDADRLLAGNVRLDPRPYREILDWFSAQHASAAVENDGALHDLTQIPAATSPAGVRRLVGIALIAAVLSVSLVLLATWRRSRRFERHSSRDVLTDLANRRRLDDDVTARSGDRVSVLMIDIDHFKKLNDTLGHAAGDQALVRVAQCIASSLRSGDLAYRYGGEEFCVLLPDADLAAASAVAERIRSAVEDLEIDGAERLSNRGITVSIGVAIDTPQSAIMDADSALYAAKNGGRNRIVTTEAARDYQLST